MEYSNVWLLYLPYNLWLNSVLERPWAQQELFLASSWGFCNNFFLGFCELSWLFLFLLHVLMSSISKDKICEIELLLWYITYEKKQETVTRIVKNESSMILIELIESPEIIVMFIYIFTSARNVNLEKEEA